MASPPSTSFDITVDADIEHSIQLNFSHTKLTSPPIYENSNMIHGRITPSSTANLTIMKNSYAVNTCVATHFYIIGNKNGGRLSHFRDASGDLQKNIPNYAELVIECRDMESSKTFRVGYLLFMQRVGTPGSESLSNLITTLQTPGSTAPTSVDFGMVIDGANTTAIENKTNTHKSYIMYDYGSYTYIISTVPINVTASLLFENNLSKGGIDFGSNIPKYKLINMVNSAEWMECEYATLDTDQVTQLLPIRSISDVKTDQSFRQIILFLVFAIALVIFYFIIPSLYQMILWKLANNDLNSMCTTMFYLDLIGNMIFIILWFFLGIAGINSKEDGSASIQSAFIIFIMHMITVGTISVSRISPNFPFEGREQRCSQKPAAAASGGSSSHSGGYPSSMMSMYH